MSGPDPQECPAGSEAYFRDFSEGRYDEDVQLGYIYPARDARLTEEGHLHVGRPGVDGLEFTIRADAAGIWVWYALDNEWRQVADDIHALDRDWRMRVLTV